MIGIDRAIRANVPFFGLAWYIVPIVVILDEIVEKGGGDVPHDGVPADAGSNVAIFFYHPSDHLLIGGRGIGGKLSMLAAALGRCACCCARSRWSRWRCSSRRTGSQKGRT